MRSSEELATACVVRPPAPCLGAGRRVLSALLCSDRLEHTLVWCRYFFLVERPSDDSCASCLSSLAALTSYFLVEARCSHSRQNRRPTRTGGSVPCSEQRFTRVCVPCPSSLPLVVLICFPSVRKCKDRCDDTMNTTTCIIFSDRVVSWKGRAFPS